MALGDFLQGAGRASRASAIGALKGRRQALDRAEEERQAKAKERQADVQNQLMQQLRTAQTDQIAAQMARLQQERDDRTGEVEAARVEFPELAGVENESTVLAQVRVLRENKSLEEQREAAIELRGTPTRTESTSLTPTDRTRSQTDLTLAWVRSQTDQGIPVTAESISAFQRQMGFGGEVEPPPASEPVNARTQGLLDLMNSRQPAPAPAAPAAAPEPAAAAPAAAAEPGGVDVAAGIVARARVGDLSDREDLQALISQAPESEAAIRDGLSAAGLSDEIIDLLLSTGTQAESPVTGGPSRSRGAGRPQTVRGGARPR